jgi:hypothetical protein
MGDQKSAFLIRLPQALHDQVRRAADAKGQSANAFLLDLIEHATPLATCPTCHGSGKVPADR